MKTCTACGRPFTPPRYYFRLCTACWRTEQDAAIRAEAWREGYAAGRAAAAPNIIDDALIMSVVRLTHPDRHPPERFAEANRVTAHVLSLRELVEVRR